MEHKITKTHILVKRKQAETTSKGGIVLPDSNKVVPLQGTVMLCGPDITIDVEVGDDILFDKFAGGTEVTLNEKSYLILDENDVLVILKNEKKES